jgi:hypothetical protein
MYTLPNRDIKPNNPNRPYLYQDVVCHKIAQYLQTQLNLRAKEEDPNLVVVNGIRSYDAFNVPLHEYPLLKVFRTGDSYFQAKTLRSSTLIARWCLVMPEQDTLQPLCNWVSWNINELLLDSNLNICPTIFISDNAKRGEYRTLVNETGQVVYSFLNFYFNTLKE